MSTLHTARQSLNLRSISKHVIKQTSRVASLFNFDLWPQVHPKFTSVFKHLNAGTDLNRIKGACRQFCASVICNLHKLFSSLKSCLERGVMSSLHLVCRSASVPRAVSLCAKRLSAIQRSDLWDESIRYVNKLYANQTQVGVASRRAAERGESLEVLGSLQRNHPARLINLSRFSGAVW